MINRLLIFAGLGTAGLVAWAAYRGDLQKVVMQTDEDEQLALARTMYGEARGEGPEGMAAVAAVIMNRKEQGGWFGSDLMAVIFKPWQFSAWNENDPNRNKIANLMPGQGNQTFDLAYEIAGQALQGTLPDRTGGATHYHTNAVSPNWASRLVRTTSIGNHIFYV